jgi:ribonuclease P protein component
LFRVGNEDGFGLGFAVSKRYGNAVKRNLFRRRVKSVFSLMNRIHFFNKPIIIQPLGRDITFSSIKESFSNLYSKNV